MTKYQSFEDILSDYAAVTERTDDNLFDEGRVIADAIDAGFPRKQVIEECAKLRGQSNRTLRYRECAYRVYEKRGKRATGISHSLHVMCLRGTDVDNPETWAKAEELLAVAADGYTDPDGNIRPHTTRTFALTLKAMGENPAEDEPQYLLDAVAARVWTCQARPDIRGNIIEIFVPGELPTLITPHTDVVITLVQANAQEANAA